jgi:hypothetical protein
MRSVLLVFGVLAGAINTLMVGRYGFVTSDTAIDGAIAAFYFGIIALGAIGGPAVAVHFLARLCWAWGGAFALLAAVALSVNVVNSLGALAGRSDKTQAERARVRDDAKDDKAQLARITAERAAMKFTPATAESVQAASNGVAAAERNRVAECGVDNEKRGTRCREREAEEQARRDTLAQVLASKVLTDTATRLEGEAAAIRARLNKAPPVQSVDPLADAISKLVDLPAEIAAAWQKASAVIVVELLIAFALVGFELLGSDGREVVAKPDEQKEPANAGNVVAMSPRQKHTDLIGRFMLKRLTRAAGEEVALTTVYSDLCRWCASQAPTIVPPDVATFGREFGTLCKRAGIRAVPRGKAIFCVDVKLADAAAAASVA